MSIELNVSGMTCGHCKAAVESALKQITGVKNVAVNLEQGKALVEGENLNASLLIAAVVEEGYSAQAVTA
jgi:copper chaperone CopZ